MQEWGEGRVKCLSPTVLPEEGLLIWATEEVLSRLLSLPWAERFPQYLFLCLPHPFWALGSSGRQRLSQMKSTVKNKAESKR